MYVEKSNDDSALKWSWNYLQSEHDTPFSQKGIDSEESFTDWFT
jgi:hypothetical protein